MREPGWREPAAGTRDGLSADLSDARRDKNQNTVVASLRQANGAAEQPATESARLQPQTYAAIPAQAMRDRRLKQADWCVLAAISFRADPTGYAWPSQDDIAATTRLSRQKVSECIRRLCDLGYVKIIESIRRRGQFRSNAYRVIRKRLPDDRFLGDGACK